MKNKWQHILILIVILFVTSIIRVNASTLELNKVSKELPMPVLLEKITKLYNESIVYVPLNNQIEISSETIITDPIRRTWIYNTQKVLEDYYMQKICKIVETEKFISFYFEPKETSVSQLREKSIDLDLESDTKLESFDANIYAIDYTKPESSMLATTYSTKVLRAYGYASAFVRVDTKYANNYQIATTVAMYMLPNVLGFVSDAIDYITNHTTSYLNNSVKLKGTTYVHYYYLNKYGYVYNEQFGIWQNWSQIGSRRSFKKVEAWNVRTDNSVYNYSAFFNEPNNPSMPTNYDRIELKTGFGSDSFVIEKAIEAYEYQYPFIDTFGMASTFLP